MQVAVIEAGCLNDLLIILNRHEILMKVKNPPYAEGLQDSVDVDSAEPKRLPEL